MRECCHLAEGILTEAADTTLPGGPESEMKKCMDRGNSEYVYHVCIIV